KIARASRSSGTQRKVVFFAIGFETTAPAHALALQQAQREGLDNFFLLVSHVLVPPAIRLLLESPHNRVNAFIAPGHVCTVMGYREYEALCRDFRVPMVVGGFEPADLLEAILMLVTQLEEGRAEVENQYVRSASREGNVPAQRAMEAVFEVCDRPWRGIGSIAQSGLRLRPQFAAFDAEQVFSLTSGHVQESPECISALVLQGLKKPMECPAFGVRCTPESPLGAPMVSAEGACAAYYHYRRHTVARPEGCDVR
ncbi:MAG: hydrogenase formation protein HypD, partial [Acidobacteria bacterium]|nr:hydrogenase formation protein HypD [Acidobacteriota bacterium]